MEKNQIKPFKALFIARSDYGKSYLISTFILQKIEQKQIDPKRIIVFSKTWKSDPSQLRYIDMCQQKYKDFKEKNCFQQIDFELIQKLFLTQQQIKDEQHRAPQHFLIVFDDMISESLLTNKQFISIYSLMRHYNISVILSLQAYRNTLSSVLRNQITLLAIGQISSQSATEDILQEIDGGIGKNKKESFNLVSSWYQDAIQSNDCHGFLVVDMTQNPWQGKKYQRNFDNYFYDTSPL